MLNKNTFVCRKQRMKEYPCDMPWCASGSGRVAMYRALQASTWASITSTELLKVKVSPRHRRDLVLSKLGVKEVIDDAERKPDNDDTMLHLLLGTWDLDPNLKADAVSLINSR
eukprot:m.170926 g.170926  ORF g.170926 m.170926 type:complete len:113 (+) comp14540_c0_seq1:965-1303(+)